jgi:hypothetical protein
MSDCGDEEEADYFGVWEGGEVCAFLLGVSRRMHMASVGAYLVDRQTLGGYQLLCTGNHSLLRPLAWPAQPLLLQDRDNLVVYGRGVAVLVVRGTTRITEHYAVVGRVHVAVTCLALGRQQRLGRLPPLDALRGLWNNGHECDGLVHAAARLCSGG